MSDYISREAAKKCIQEWLTKAKYPANKSKYNEGEIAAYETSIDTIDELPSADVAPVVHGEWICCTTSEHWCCSKCGIRAPMTWDPLHQEYIEWLSPACQNCGAKMDGGDPDAAD